MFFKGCTLDTEFLSSGQGIMKVLLLGTGGGVFGIIAQSGIRTPPAEALMWVSIFAWVTTLIVFLYAAYGQKFYNAWGEFYYSLIISILYIVVTVVWAVYMTFPITMNPIGLLVFLLALITTLLYIVQILVAFGEAQASVANAAQSTQP